MTKLKIFNYNFQILLFRKLLDIKYKQLASYKNWCILVWRQRKSIEKRQLSLAKSLCISNQWKNMRLSLSFDKTRENIVPLVPGQVGAWVVNEGARADGAINPVNETPKSSNSSKRKFSFGLKDNMPWSSS